MIDENSMTPYENKVRRNLLTNAGRQIFLEAGDGLGTIVYTRATLSSQKLVDVNGNEFDNNTVREINNLADDLKEGQIKLGKIADDHFEVIADFNNENQFSDISFNTIGWYARLDTVGSDGGTTEGKEVLMVITEMTDQPTTLPACSTDGLSTQSISIELDMAISNAADIKMTAERNDYVTHTEFNVWKTKIIADIKASSLDPNIDQIKENTIHIQEVQGAGKFVQVYLTDQNGTYITDQNGARIVGNKWLPMVDKTLTQSDLPADAKAVGDAIAKSNQFDATKYGIPVLYLYGDRITSLKDKKSSLENEVRYNFPKYHIKGTCTNFKVQGASSATLPKKNWTLNLDQSIEIFHGYGKQHKYVVKANMTDFSQARNVVSAKIWGKIANSKIKIEDVLQDDKGNYMTDDKGNHIIFNADPQLSIGGNYGAVDGFPIVIYVNDKYWGLYSFNIPKDDWMAKMPKKQGYAILDAVWKPQGSFKAETNLNDGLEVQFSGTKNTDWIKTSINKLIDVCLAHYDTKEAFDTAVSNLIDINNAIDYLLYSIFIDNTDGVYRNYLLQTFNGTKWYLVPYDLDETYGRAPQTWSYLSPDDDGQDPYWNGVNLNSLSASNRLFYQLIKFHRDDINSRYKELVSSTMSVGSLLDSFNNYLFGISKALTDQEVQTWPQTPETQTNNFSQIRWWYDHRINWLNQVFSITDSKQV